MTQHIFYTAVKHDRQVSSRLGTMVSQESTRDTYKVGLGLRVKRQVSGRNIYQLDLDIGMRVR